jgi:LysM domain-containing protein
MTSSARSRMAVVLAVLLGPSVVAAQDNPTHTVNKGDTLWDLARTYLGDPFLWPEIYRLNTDVVEDPHWIYPGEVLRLKAGDQPVSAVPPTDTPVPPQAAPVDSAASNQVVADGQQAPVVEEPAAEAAPAAEPALTEPQVGDLAEANDRDTVDLSVLVGVRRRAQAGPSIESLMARKFRPVRRTEFYSSGFLTEGAKLPSGNLLGTVTPTQIEEVSTRDLAMTYAKVAVKPPEGGSYQVGDTLLVIVLERELSPHGRVVLPTGLVRVTDVSRPENTAEVIATYAPIRSGQLVLPAEKFNDPGNVRPVPISDGVRGEVIDTRDPQILKGPQDVVFINRGKEDGVGLGDVFEIRQTPRQRLDAATTLNEVIGTLQIVHVGPRTATGRIVRVTEPKIPSGTEVRQVAKLPS